MKKGIITIIVVAAIVAGGSYYFMHNSKRSISNNTNSKIASTTSQNTASNNTKPMNSSNQNSIRNTQNATSNQNNSSNTQHLNTSTSNNSNQQINNNNNNNNQTNTHPQNIANSVSNSSTNNNSKKNNSTSKNAENIQNQFVTLGNEAYHLGIPSSTLVASIYNAVQSKIPNNSFLIPTLAQQQIISHGTKAQKDALIKELGANRLLINVGFNTFQNDTNSQITPQSYDNANKNFYYGFMMTTLSKMCESTNNRATYSGYIDKAGNLLPIDQYNKLCGEKNMYVLNVQSQTPAFNLPNQINIG